MTHVYQNWDFGKRENILNFYLKRFAKIYPAYAVTTFVFFIFFREQTFTVAQWTRIAVNDLFLVQAFFPSMWSLGLNGGTWSLTVEMFLYMLFPLLSVLLNKSEKFLWFAVILGAILTLNANLEKTDYLYANPVFRIDDFVIGMGFYYLKDKQIFKSKIFHAFLVVGLIKSVKQLGDFDYWFLQAHLLFILFFGAWIACVFNSKSAIYDNKILVYCGLISYSFYLWQFLAIQFGKYLLSHQFSVIEACISAFAINICFSVISYHLLEERLRIWILKNFGKSLYKL